MGKNKGNIEVKNAYEKYEIAILNFIKRCRNAGAGVYRLKDKIKDELTLKNLDKLTIDDGIIFFVNIGEQRERFLLMWQIKSSKKHLEEHRNHSPGIIGFLLRIKASTEQIEKDIIVMHRKAFKESIYKRHLPFFKKHFSK